MIKFPEKKLFQRLKVYFQTGLARKLLGGWKVFFGVFWNVSQEASLLVGQYRLWSNSTCLWMHGAHHQGLGDTASSFYLNAAPFSWKRKDEGQRKGARCCPARGSGCKGKEAWEVMYAKSTATRGRTHALLSSVLSAMPGLWSEMGRLRCSSLRGPLMLKRHQF